MKKGLKIVAVSMACTFAGAGCSIKTPTASTKSPFTEAQYTKVTQFLSQQMKQDDIPGVAVAVVAHGRVVFFKGMGYANVTQKTKVTEDTVFAIGSLTKSMTATAILQLRDKGLLNLDDKVTKFLPWFKVEGASGSQITIRELLNQSSGLPTSAPDTVMNYLPSNGTTTLEQGVRALSHVKLAFQPGTDWAYSNMNYNVLGLIIEKVTGQPYIQYMQSHLLNPLQMTHTVFDVSKVDSSNLAGKYIVSAESPNPLPTPPLGPKYEYEEASGARLASSVTDMVKYVSFELGDSGHSVLTKSSLDEAHTNGVPTPLGGDYAYGWIDVPAVTEPSYYWHNGSTPGSFSLVLLYPSKDSGVILFANTWNVPSDLGIDQITSILMGS